MEAEGAGALLLGPTGGGVLARARLKRLASLLRSTGQRLISSASSIPAAATAAAGYEPAASGAALEGDAEAAASVLQAFRAGRGPALNKATVQRRESGRQQSTTEQQQQQQQHNQSRLAGLSGESEHLQHSHHLHHLHQHPGQNQHHHHQPRQRPRRQSDNYFVQQQQQKRYTSGAGQQLASAKQTAPGAAYMLLLLNSPEQQPGQQQEQPGQPLRLQTGFEATNGTETLLGGGGGGLEYDGDQITSGAAAAAAAAAAGLSRQWDGEMVVGATETTWSLLMSAFFHYAGPSAPHLQQQHIVDVNWPNVALASFLVLLILTTAIGNLFVIVAILIERNLRTIGNYLVLSLAIADLLVALLVMPLAGIYQILDRWTLGVLLCDIWTSADVFCCTASILHLLAIALDRYWAVTRVDYIRCQRNERRILFMILLVWLTSSVIGLAPVLGWKDEAFEWRITQDNQCLISQDIGYQVFATCFTFYFPVTLTLIFYWKIYQVARKRIRRKLGNRVKVALQQPSSSSSGSAPLATTAGSTGRPPPAPPPLQERAASAGAPPAKQMIVDYAPGMPGRDFSSRLERGGADASGPDSSSCQCACHKPAGQQRSQGAALGRADSRGEPATEAASERHSLATTCGGPDCKSINQLGELDTAAAAANGTDPGGDAERRRATSSDEAGARPLDGDAGQCLKCKRINQMLSQRPSAAAAVAMRATCNGLAEQLCNEAQGGLARANCTKHRSSTTSELQQNSQRALTSSGLGGQRRAPEEERAAEGNDQQEARESGLEASPSGGGADRRSLDSSLTQMSAPCDGDGDDDNDDQDDDELERRQGEQRQRQHSEKSQASDTNFNGSGAGASSCDCCACICCDTNSNPDGTNASGAGGGGSGGERGASEERDEEPEQAPLSLASGGQNLIGVSASGPKQMVSGATGGHRVITFHEERRAPGEVADSELEGGTGPSARKPGEVCRRVLTSDNNNTTTTTTNNSSNNNNRNNNNMVAAPNGLARPRPAAAAMERSPRLMAFCWRRLVAMQQNTRLFGGRQNSLQPALESSGTDEEPASSRSGDTAYASAVQSPAHKRQALAVVSSKDATATVLMGAPRVARCSQCNCPAATAAAAATKEPEVARGEAQVGGRGKEVGLLIAAASTAQIVVGTTVRRSGEGLGLSNRTAPQTSPGAGAKDSALVGVEQRRQQLQQQQQSSTSTLHQSVSLQNHAANLESVESKRERKAFKTLAIITGVFVMCWLPFFVMALLMPLVQLKPPKLLFAFLLWLGYFNSMLNPIIYTIFSPDFRKAFKRLLCSTEQASTAATARCRSARARPSSIHAQLAPPPPRSSQAAPPN